MTAAAPTRALGIIRLSKRNEESTSPNRQRLAIAEKARALGVTELEIVEDLAVSAFHKHPMERPRLKAKLGDEELLGRLDYIIFYRQDRFVRRLFPDFSDMAALAARHKIRLMSATEELGDVTQHAEMLVPIIKAWLGEGESRSTSSRMADTHAYLRAERRWGGGWPPYGYAPAPNPNGDGFVLVIDPVAAKIVRELVTRVIAGASVNSVVADFNRRGVISPHNRRRQLAGRPLTTRDGTDTSGARWQATAAERILRNPALLGYVVHEKAAVAGKDGTPLVRADPLISLARWDQLQEALRTRGKAGGARRTQTPSMLLRVAFCQACGHALHRAVQTRGERRHVYYRCGQAARRSDAVSACSVLPVRADWLESLAADLFLAEVGHVLIMKRIYSAGSGHAERRELVHRALKAARGEHDSGGYTYAGGEEEYQERVAGLAAQLRELEGTPEVAAGYREVETGQTYGQMWEATPDAASRRALMAGAGFRIYVARTAERTTLFHEIDPDLARRAGLAASGRPVHVPAPRLPGSVAPAGAVVDLAARRRNGSTSSTT